jgi:hypothetical protein
MSIKVKYVTEGVKFIVDGEEISFGEYVNDIRKELV